MKFGGQGENHPREWSRKQQIKEQINSETQLNGDGYMTAIYNMIFLLQTRIAKQMKGETMDEEIFRTYFIRLFKGIRQME